MNREFVEQMRKANQTDAINILEDIEKALTPIRNKCQKIDKQNESIIVSIYVRKGNDIITSGTAGGLVSTSATHSDYVMVLHDLNLYVLDKSEIEGDYLD